MKPLAQNQPLQNPTPRDEQTLRDCHTQEGIVVALAGYFHVGLDPVSRPPT